MVENKKPICRRCKGEVIHLTTNRNPRKFICDKCICKEKLNYLFNKITI